MPYVWPALPDVHALALGGSLQINTFLKHSSPLKGFFQIILF